MGKGMCHEETTGKSAAYVASHGGGVSVGAQNRTSRNLIHVNANILYRFYKLSLFAINH